MGIFSKIKNLLCGNNKKIMGVIKFFDRKKRFGFIIAGEKEYFFHASAAKPSDFNSLQDGISVKFNIVQGRKGLQADNIEIGN